MSADVAAASTERRTNSVGGTVSETASIQVEQLYPQAPEVVWRALTEPALHAKWWAAGDVKPVVGHRFELDMGAWGRQPCEVLAAEPNRLFSYRFAAPTLDTVITWKLVPEGQGTRLSLVHGGFQVGTPMGQQAYGGMKAGWPGVLARLASVLGT